MYIYIYIEFDILVGKNEIKVTVTIFIKLTNNSLTNRAPPPMEFSWQEYWSGLPFPSPKRNIDT